MHMQVDCTEMRVGSACTQPSWNDKNASSVFFFIFLYVFPSQIKPSSNRRPSHDCWLTAAFQHRPALARERAVNHSSRVIVDTLERCLWAEWRLRDCGVLGCNKEHSHVDVPESEPLKTQWLSLFSKGLFPTINVNAVMFARIISLGLLYKRGSV